MAGLAAPERRAERRLAAPVRPIGRTAPPWWLPKSRLPPEAGQADPAAAGRRSGPGGASPPSPVPARSSRASGRPAIRARRHEPLPRPDQGIWPDPDTPRCRRRPGPGPWPATRGWSCRWSLRRAGLWLPRAATRPGPGWRPGPQSRLVSPDPMPPANCSVCPAGLPHPRPDSDAALPPGPPRPRHPGAELLHPSVPGGMPERPGRSVEGRSWGANTRTDVLYVKYSGAPGSLGGNAPVPVVASLARRIAQSCGASQQMFHNGPWL